jgi:nucleoside-diphosphate-sugar epimerase
MKTILVTGGAGYVGSILVPKLLKKGCEVVVLDTLFFTDIGLRGVRSNPKLKILEGDIRDVGTLKSTLKDIDAVIHLASISNDPSSDLNPRLTVEVNYDATLNLVRIAKESGVKRFINASTSSVYGINDSPDVTEDLPLEPLTVYSKTKADAEPFVLKANDKGFAAVNIRPATVCGYSPKMRLDLTVNILTMHALTKGKITVFGGNQKRPNIHIEDITDYYAGLIEIGSEKIAGKTFNAGYENFTVMEIAEIVKDIIGKNVAIEVTPTNDDRSYHISSAKIEKELGLKPKKTIRDAVLDIKVAHEKGLLDWGNINFYNVKKMKTLMEKGTVLAG